LFLRGIFKATLTTLCLILSDDIQMNTLKVVVGHGIVVQPSCTNIRFG